MATSNFFRVEWKTEQTPNMANIIQRQRLLVTKCWISYEYSLIWIVFLCHLCHWAQRSNVMHWWATSLAKSTVHQSLGTLPVECTTASAKTHQTNTVYCSACTVCACASGFMDTAMTIFKKAFISHSIMC